MPHADRFATLRALFVCRLSTEATGESLWLEEQIADAPVEADRQGFKGRALEAPSHPPHSCDCENTQQLVDGVAQPQGMFGQDF